MHVRFERIVASTIATTVLTLIGPGSAGSQELKQPPVIMPQSVVPILAPSEQRSSSDADEVRRREMERQQRDFDDEAEEQSKETTKEYKEEKRDALRTLGQHEEQQRQVIERQTR